MDSNMRKEGLALISITKLGWKSKTNSMKGYLLVYLLFAFAKKRCSYINLRTINSCHIFFVPTLLSGAKITKHCSQKFVYNMFQIKTLIQKLN